MTVFQPSTKAELKTAVDAWCVDSTSATGTYGDINDWNTSLITNMVELFGSKTYFNDTISNWDVSKVTDMKYMFSYAEAFNQPIGNWDVSKVSNMNGMFNYARAFNQPIGNWDVSKVTDMGSMFLNAVDFNQYINNWNVSKVTTMNSMFSGAHAFNQPIGDWNVSKVNGMNRMFNTAKAFNQQIGNWDVSNVSIMSRMFLNSENFNQPIGDWDVSNVTDMGMMFGNAYDFNQPIGDWNVSKARWISQMFANASDFNQYIRYWTVKENANMYNMFAGATKMINNQGASADPIDKAGDPNHASLTYFNQPVLTPEAPTGNIIITGTVTEDQELTVNTSELVDRNGLPDPSTYNHQWHRTIGGTTTDVSGETGTTYTLTSDDVGSTMTVTVSYTDNQSFSNTITSDPTTVVRQYNRPPAGSVTISGTVTEGQELTVNTSALVDLNGLPDPSTYNYQWHRTIGGTTTDVSGETGVTYTLTSEDVGSTMTVTVSYTDNDNYLGTKDSLETTVVRQYNRPPSGSITISGTVIEVEELTVNTSALVDLNGLPDPSTYNYQWYRTNAQGTTSEISGETGTTYTLTSEDVGSTMTVTVSYVDNADYSNTITSDPTIVVNQFNRSPDGTVTISGPASEYETLTASNDLTDVNGPNPLEITYQWKRDGSDISGENLSYYNLTSDDVGSKMTVTASYTDNAGYFEIKESAETMTVRQANRAPFGTVTISGTVIEDETLTASNDLTDPNGPNPLVITYQWNRTNAQGTTTGISGETGATYKLTSDDVGSKMTVTASYTDNAGYFEIKDSSETTVVIQYNRPPEGTVTLTGDPTSEETLSIDTSNLVDFNGLPDGITNHFSYQWHGTINEITTNINGETNPNYTLTSSDIGKTIGVTVTYIDGDGYSQEVESIKTTPVKVVNIPPTGTVSISGIPIDGQELSVDTSEIVDLNGPAVLIFSYQWHSTINGTKTNINGETNSTYTLTSSDIGKTIGVTVTYTDDGNHEEGFEPSQTDTIIAINSDPTGDVTITGTITDGEVLDVDTSNLVDLNGLPDGITNHFSYQWHRILGDGTKSIISNVTTTSTHTLIPADVGKQIEVTVIYTDGDGYPQTVESIKTVPVREANVLPTGTTTILGSLYIGNTLTVNNDIVDENGLPNSSTFIYQWKRTISGTTTNVSNEDTYLLGLDDVGSTMTVSVSYTDQALYQENVISAPTGEILRFKPVNRDALKTAFNLASSNSANALLQYGEVNLWDTSLITDMNNLYYYNNSFALGWGWFNPDISNWDVSNVTNMRYMFYRSKGFNININGWDVSKVKDMYQMFGYCTWFNQPLDEWDVSQVTDMRNMFSYATDFNQNLRDWDVQPNTTLYYMFNGATRMTNNHATANTPDKPTIYSYFKQIFKPDTKDKLKVAIGDWDSINAYTVSNYKDITTWDTSLLTDISWLFAYNTTFNGDISGWDVSNVTNMTKTFYKSTNFNKPIGNWDVSKVTKMFEMFDSCTWFNQPLDEWDVSKVTDMRYMYQNATAFDQPIKYWTPKTSGIMFYNMFLGATKMNDNHFAPSTPTSTGFFHKSRNVAPSGTVTITGVTREKMELTVNTSGLVDQNGHGTFTLPNGVSTTYTYQWHRTSNGTTTNIGEPTSSPTYTLVPADVGHTIGVKVIYIDHDVHHQNFESQLTVVIDPFNLVRDINSAVTLWINNNSTALSTYGVIDGWDTSLITDMGTLFKDKASFNSDIGGWNVANVTNMESMFDNANAFNQPIGNWDVSNVTNMQSMFYHAHEFDQPIGNWNVSNVTNMYRMFLRAQDFNKPIGNWNVANVTNMESMFDNAKAFNQNIGDWNVSNVTNMYRMFLHVQDFNQPIGNWNVSNVTNMEWMLCGAQVFNKPIGNWNVTNVTNMNHMFELASKFNQDISSWDVSNVNNMNKMFFNASDFDQFIRQWEVGTNTSTVSMFLGATKMINNQQASVSPARSPIDYFNVPDNYPLDASAEVTISDLFPAQGYPLSAATNFDGLDNNGVPDSSTYTFQWHRTKDGTTTDIPGATAPTHTLTNDEVGFTITVTASYTDLHGYQESKTSDIATGEVIKFKPNTREQLKEAVDLWISNNTNAQTTYGDINTEWNTSLVEDMSELFQGKTSFNDDISNWNVSNVTTMNSMFDNAKAFNQNIGGWNTSKVTNMDSLFYTAEAFNQNIGSWNVSKVTTMSNMFKNTNNFDQPIGNWDVSKVTTMESMFNWTQAFNQSIGNWDVSKVTNMTSIFHGAQVFNQEIDNWNVSNVTSMTSMFNEAQDFNKPIGNWDVKNVTTLESMFQKAKQFNQDIGNWNLAGVTNMTSMFNEAEKFDKDISTKPSVTMNGSTYSAWDVSGVTSMYLMFSTAKAFNQNIGNWDVSNVTNMALMFYNANAFNQDIGNWVVSNVTNMAYMFNSANVFDQNIRDWNVAYMFNSANAFNQDIGNWVVSNVTNMAYMFNSANVFDQNIRDWNVQVGTDLTNMFSDLMISNRYAQETPTYHYFGLKFKPENRTELETAVNLWISNKTSALSTYGLIGYWDTSSVTDMSTMFHNKTTFNDDISGWDVSNVNNMYGMFLYAYTFNQDIGNWNVSNVTNMQSMFQHNGASSHFNQDISGWNVSNVNNMVQMFHSAETFDQNIRDWDVQPTWTDEQGTEQNTNLSNMFAGKKYCREYLVLTREHNAHSPTPVYSYFKQRFKPTSKTLLGNAVNQWCLGSNSSNRPYALSNYGDISGWDTSLRLTDMSTMFDNKTTFNDDISGWDVSKVTNMYAMFYNAQAFNQDIGNWDVKNVENMKQMFRLAYKFNKPIDNWNVSKVTDMSYMFVDAQDFNNGDLGDSNTPLNWKVSNVNDMSEMFLRAYDFEQNLREWDVQDGTILTNMFHSTTKMKIPIIMLTAPPQFTPISNKGSNLPVKLY